MGKNLDAELAEAAGLDDDDPTSDASDHPGMSVPQPPEPRPAVAPPRSRPGSSDSARNVGLLVALLLMVAGIVCLFMFGFKEAAIYSMPVDQFLAKRSEMIDRRVRIEGELVVGSLMKRDKPCEFRFRVKAGGQELPVRYAQCIVPDTFRDVPQGGVEVTAEGKLVSEGHFEATLIMAKCSSKYDPETHTMQGGEQAKAE